MYLRTSVLLSFMCFIRGVKFYWCARLMQIQQDAANMYGVSQKKVYTQNWVPDSKCKPFFETPDSYEHCGGIEIHFGDCTLSIAQDDIAHQSIIC